MPTEEQIKKVTKALADEGLLIEAAFYSFRWSAIDPACTPKQLQLARYLFFAGAQHLFTIMSFLDEGEEETEGDINRMSQVAAELEKFGKLLEMRQPARGNA
jgi:hypothetical protein